MGYTHYWKILKTPIAEAVQRVLNDIPKIREATKKIKIQY